MISRAVTSFSVTTVVRGHVFRVLVASGMKGTFVCNIFIFSHIKY
jgi:hypothetical protein